MKQSFTIVLLIFINFIDLSSSAKQPVKTQEDTLPFLTKYGYNPCANSTAPCSLSLTSLLKDYQQRFHLTTSGKLDETTKKHMNRPRCGNHDHSLSAPARLEEVKKWLGSSLTYSIRGYPTQISQVDTTRIIREAFDAWLHHIPLKIEPVCSTCDANFVLDFARERHSDAYPFDGIGGTLAHAFFPEDGRVHFDKDETWTKNFEVDNTNLYFVAVHEIGHALGLDHIYNEESIMYPSYQLKTEKTIPGIDQRNIQKIYGNKQFSPVTSTTTRSTTTTTTRKSIIPTKSTGTKPSGKLHPRCHRFLDTALKYPDGTLHTFDAGVLWRYLPDENIWENRPTTFHQTYARLPKRLAAGVYNSETKEFFFFTNKDVYHYDLDDHNRVKYHDQNSLPRNLHHSIMGAIYYRNEIYVITSKTIRLFQVSKHYQATNERNLSEEFPRFTGTVKTAFSYGELHYFFTVDRLVYVWNEHLNDWETFGKPMETSWFACLHATTYIPERLQDHKPHRNPKHRDRHHHHDHHH